MEKMKKLFDETRILSDNEVNTLCALFQDVLDPIILEQAEKYNFNFEHTIRFHAVAAKCKRSREKLGLSIKDVASELKLPQYRLKAIEKGTFKEIKPDILKKYLTFLNLERWFNKWATNNPELEERIGI